jgi:hypothetical protein
VIAPAQRIIRAKERAMDLTTRAKLQLGELLFGHLQLQQQLEDSEKARGEAVARAQAALEKLATLDHPKKTNSANDAEKLGIL